MAVEISANAQRWLARAPAVANVILVVLIGLLCARLFWLLWPAPESSYDLTPQSTRAATAGGGGAAFDVNVIANAHLFGTPPAGATAEPKPEIINAPETRLNLVLTGIVSNRAGGRSRAMIKNEKGEQGSYAIGDDIISGVKLHDIYINKVILERNGRYETLTLESVKNARAITRVADDMVSGDVAGKLSAIRSQILANPAMARRYIRLQPARQNGSLIGYRIYPGPERGLFKQTGLQPGAVVTAINGQPLNNPAKALRTLSQVATASSVSFTLLHNGQQRTVTVRFE